MTRTTRMLRIAILGALLCVSGLSMGCVSKELYREAAQSGWERWEQDKRPTLSNEDYTALSEEERKLYLPEAKVNARLFERDNALRLLKD